MDIFHYKEDRIPVSIFVLVFLIDLCVYFTVSSIPLLIFLSAVGIPIKAFISAWNHHHQHCPTFHLPVLNRLLEIIFGFQTGIVGYAWVLHHNLGHHMHYLDQTKDESAWKSPKGKRYSKIMYTLIVSATAYYRAWIVGKNYPKIRRYFFFMCLVQFSLLAFLLAYNTIAGLLLFALPMVTSLILTVFTTYHHHSGLESQDHLHASYNILAPWYNLLSGNLGYHTAHHMKGSLHWSRLPEFHHTLEGQIEPMYYKKYNIISYKNMIGNQAH